MSLHDEQPLGNSDQRLSDAYALFLWAGAWGPPMNQLDHGCVTAALCQAQGPSRSSSGLGKGPIGANKERPVS